MNEKTSRILAILLVGWLAACATIPASVDPNMTAASQVTFTSTPGETAMPVPTQTATASPTAEVVNEYGLQPEPLEQILADYPRAVMERLFFHHPELGWVKEYALCPSPENFRDCPVPVEDLFNGRYHRWLKTLSQSFDSGQLKWVDMMQHPFSPIIIYDDETAPNYKNVSERPYRRNVTAGTTALAMPDGTILEYAILPVEFADPTDPQNPKKNFWVIGINELYRASIGKTELAPKGIMREGMRIWVEKMNMAPFVMGNTHPYNANVVIALADMTWQKYGEQEMRARFERFMSNDPSALDGMVLKVDIARSTKGVYE
ncbi:MAG: hypothetical protein QGD88_02440 [Anaerolineae bacterium]|nr:hypothetical protein [Anaerolineae bacterium]